MGIVSKGVKEMGMAGGNWAPAAIKQRLGLGLVLVVDEAGRGYSTNKRV